MENASNLPKHTKVKIVNIYGEEIDAVIIPLSIKGTMDVEAFIEKLKLDLSENRDIRMQRFKKSLDSENPTDDELKESYVESKITMDLAKLNEEITEERIKSLKAKRFDKLIAGKTRENLLSELAEIAIELDIRKQVLSHTVSRTLWNVLRKPDNLREYIFEDVIELEDSLDPNTLVNIFTNDIVENKIEEDDLKN